MTEERVSTPTYSPPVWRFVSEGVGTGLLLVAIVGSGIMADRLADGQVAVALLAHAPATGAALATLILIFGPVSGTHFNPAVAVSRALTDTFSGIRPVDVRSFVLAELTGAFAATVLFRCLVPSLPAVAADVTVPHPDP